MPQLKGELFQRQRDNTFCYKSPLPGISIPIKSVTSKGSGETLQSSRFSHTQNVTVNDGSDKDLHRESYMSAPLVADIEDLT